MISRSFKRKNSDRSPEDPPASQASSRYQMVCVLIPSPPRPLHLYSQLEHQASPTLSQSMMPPPISTTPSFASFDSFPAGTGQRSHYEVDRLRLVVNASQEDLRLQTTQFDEERLQIRQRYEAREKQLLERFDAERRIYTTRIQELEQELAVARGSRR